MKRIPALAIGTTLLAIGACSESRTVTAPEASRPAPVGSATFDRNAEDSDAPPIAIMETRERALAHNEASRRGGGTGIFYHGGPLLTSATNVVAIYWAKSPIYSGGPAAGSSGAGSADGSLVGYFLAHLGGSRYFNINTTYYNGSGTHVANGVNYTHYWANSQYNVPAAGANVSDAQMIAMLQYGLDHGYLTYDASTLYHIFSAGTANLGGGFGTQYCAYHTSGTVTVNGASRTILYSAMPYDYAYPSACTNGTAAPNGDPAADAEVNVLAHETEETTTDMLGNAWFDRRGNENGDKCAWNFGATSSNGTGIYNITIGARNFLVQQNWINSGSGGCVQGL